MGEIKVASLNLGILRNWEELQLHSQLTSQVSSNEKNIGKKSIIEVGNISNIRDLHNKAVKIYLEELLVKFSPSLLCLQNYLHKESYQPIRSILEESSYNLVEGDKVAIAYRTTEYQYQEEINNHTSQHSSLLYIDLLHKTSQKVICIASIHLSPINSIEQKNATEMRRGNLKELSYNAKFDTPKLNDHSKIGDNDLRFFLEDLTKRDKTKNLIAPSFVICGASLYATAKDVSNKKEKHLHPCRIRLFEQNSFQRDLDSKSDTTFDFNDFKCRKYDYAFIKQLELSMERISIKDHILETINHPSLFKQPGFIMSNHLPVLSTISWC